MSVTIDGAPLRTITNAEPGFGTYGPVTIDASSAVAPGNHLLQFSISSTGPTMISDNGPGFLIDDVSLTAPDAASPPTDPPTDPPTTPPTDPTTPTPSGSCRGKVATIVGTEQADVLSGTPGVDVIAALGGADKVSGADGNDLICGGGAKDTLKGGNGKDSIFGEGGADLLKGNGGNDKCAGGPGTDTEKSC